MACMLPLAYRRALTSALLFAAACGDNGNTATSGTETESSGSTSTTTTTSSSSTTDAPTTSGSSGSSSGSSSTGPMPAACSTILDETECKLNDACEWAAVVGYTHGTQGCQGNIKNLCAPADSPGGIFVYWRDNNGDIEVVQFPFEPSDLGPEWQACDCNGPLACLCTAVPLDCPDRLSDFCNGITNENGCLNALASGSLVCEWFGVSPEGPQDGQCTGDPVKYTCLNATKLGTDTCDPISLPYPGFCDSWTDPVYWRDNGGVIELTTRCGPAPVGWNLCVTDDPNQPDECKCRCL